MSDFYWVAGTGNWADSTNWSSESGGAGGHSEGIPNAITENAIFDANSFSGADQVVTVAPQLLQIGDLDFSDVTNNPTLSVVDSTVSTTYMAIITSGNVYIPSGVTVDFSTDRTGSRVFTLRDSTGDSVNHIKINTALNGVTAFTITDKNSEEGSANIIIAGAFSVPDGDVTIDCNVSAIASSVATITAGTDITLADRDTGETPDIDLDNITLSCAGDFNNTMSETFDGDARGTVVMTGSSATFNGGAYTYNSLTINDTVTFSTSCTITTLVLEAAAVLTLPYDTTQVVTSITCNGTSDDLTTIQSSTDLYRAHIRMSNKSKQVLDWCSIKNISFVGTTLFRAANSFDLGGNLGIRFIDVTLTNLLNDIDVSADNAFTAAQKLIWLNNAIRRLWRYFNDETNCDFDTIADQGVYGIPSDMDFEYINNVFVSDSTTTLSSTTLWTEYKFAGTEDEKTGKSWYRYGDKIGLYPAPTETGYHVRIKYDPRSYKLASTDIEIPNINQDFLDAIKYETMASISGAGSSPDIEARNNYKLEAMDLVRQAQMARAKKKANNPTQRISYKEGWDD